MSCALPLLEDALLTLLSLQSFELKSANAASAAGKRLLRSPSSDAEPQDSSAPPSTFLAPVEYYRIDSAGSSSLPQGSEPPPAEQDLRLAPGQTETQVSRTYQAIVDSRGNLKRLNTAVEAAKCRQSKSAPPHLNLAESSPLTLLPFGRTSRPAGTSSQGRSVATDSLFSSAFFLVFLIDLAHIGVGLLRPAAINVTLANNLIHSQPGLQLLQPVRLCHHLLATRRARTPRQRFRATKPAPFDPTLQEALCLVAVFYSAALSLLFPILGVPAFVVLLLAFVAVRYTAYYVHASTTGGPSGGELTPWLVSRFGVLVCLTPLVYGLVLASRRLWSYAAGISCHRLLSQSRS